MEGKRVLSNYDIYKQDGAGKAVVKTFENVPVTDGSLSITLTSVANNAIISAIEIERVSEETVRNSEASPSAASEDDQNNVLQLKVFPNPISSDRFYVELRNFAENEAVTLTMHDGLGRPLVTDRHGASRAEIPLRNGMSRGVYLIRAQAVSGNKQSRLVVE
jgi:hypothetical protein